MPGSATIQNNQLDLEVVDGFEQGVYALMTPSTSIRIEADVTIPGPGNQFFNTYHVRNDGGNGDHYYVMIARLDPGLEPVVQIAKSVGGFNTTLSGANFDLSDAITKYKLRAEINGFEIRAAVRDFSLGAIPTDAVDILADDNIDQSIPQAGVAKLNMTNQAADGTDSVLIDNVRIFVITQEGLSVDAAAMTFALGTINFAVSLSQFEIESDLLLITNAQITFILPVDVTPPASTAGIHVDRLTLLIERVDASIEEWRALAAAAVEADNIARAVMLYNNEAAAQTFRARLVRELAIWQGRLNEETSE